MQTEIVAALIGAAAIVLAAIIHKIEEISNWFRPTGRSTYLKGTWQCQWTVLSPDSRHPLRIDDQVSIDRVNGALIRGSGSSPGFGKYRFKGKTSEFVVDIRYCGEGDKKDLVGVVLLQKHSPNKLDGVWCQIAADGILKSGATTWQKNP